MNTSQRIKTITELLLPSEKLLDVGCDHGYVTILAVKNGTAKEAIASDINEGPLERALENIKEEGLEEKICTVLSDGLENISESFDQMVICGMGGLLIRDILENGREKLTDVHQMILSPHSEAYALRKYLAEETAFGIISETALIDAGKFYSIFDVRRKERIPDYRIPSDRDCRFGDPSLQKEPMVYKEMIRDLLRIQTAALNKARNGVSENARVKAKELEISVENLTEILSEIQ